MTTASGNLVIIGLGTTDVKYYWKGKELQGIIKVFVYKGTSLTMKVLDKSIIPEELKESGIKIKEQR